MNRTTAQSYVGIINARIDAALSQNRRAETIITALAVAIFVLGVVIAVAGYWRQNPYVFGGAVLPEVFLYWPMLLKKGS